MKWNALLFLTCVTVLLLNFACDAGETGNENTDGDASDPRHCYDDADCFIGYYCDLINEICLEYPSGWDGKKECVDDLDCDQGYVCDLESGLCLPAEPTDGDEEEPLDGDLSDGDEEDETAEGELQVRCDDHLPCTEDAYNGTDCDYVLKPDYCLIGGICHEKDQLKTGEQCISCRPAFAKDDWTIVVDGTQCEDNLSCTLDDVCKSGLCEGTELDCDDLIDCTEDSCVEPNGCRNLPKDDACIPDQSCDPVLGCTDGCTQDSYRCINQEREKCSAGGEWQPFETCEDPTPLCTAEGCVGCENGAKYCEGSTTFVCVDNNWQSEYCFGPQPSCQNGACVPCENGDEWCGHAGDEDWGLYVCESGEWVLDKDCKAPTPMCGDLGEGLVCLECPPGTYRCDGLSHQVCDENGIWQIDPCPADQPYCSEGACVVCMGGDTRCGDPDESEERNDVYLCASVELGNSWSLQGPCPEEAPNCVDGVCEACTPEETRCGDDPQSTEVCNEDGLWVDGPDCEGGNYCDPETGECSDGWSLSFDGVSRMEIADDNFDYDPNAEFTLEAWIFPTELSGNCDTSGNTILEKWAAWPVGTYMLAVCADFYGRPNVARFFAIVDDGVQDYFHSSDDSIDVGQWNHIAVVWAEDRMDMYINGAREVSRLNYIGWKTPNTYQQNVLAVGQLDTWPDWGFKGYIDEVRISKIARYDGDSYTPEMYFSTDGLTTGLWHLDDFTDTDVCIDASGHNDGDNSYGADYNELGVGETP